MADTNENLQRPAVTRIPFDRAFTVVCEKRVTNFRFLDATYEYYNMLPCEPDIRRPIRHIQLLLQVKITACGSYLVLLSLVNS